MTQPQAPTPPPRRPRRKWPFVLLGILVLIVIIAVANSGKGTVTSTGGSASSSSAAGQSSQPAPVSSAASVAPAPAAKPTGSVVTYEVTGTGGVSSANNITYVKDSHFGQQQANGVKLPWSTKVTFDAAGPFSVQPLSLVAQSGSGGSGSITCRILRDGQEVTSSTSSGPYAVVTCSGT